MKRDGVIADYDKVERAMPDRETVYPGSVIGASGQVSRC